MVVFILQMNHVFFSGYFTEATYNYHTAHKQITHPTIHKLHTLVSKRHLVQCQTVELHYQIKCSVSKTHTGRWVGFTS